MSSFTEAQLIMLDNFRWKLAKPLSYHVGEYPSKTIIKVPKGTETDMASIPRILWAFFPPTGRWAKAAILHDYLYSKGCVERIEADKIFLESMKVLGVCVGTRAVFYSAVRLFGGRRHRAAIAAVAAKKVARKIQLDDRDKIK
jgi:hypothetical protein